MYPSRGTLRWQILHRINSQCRVLLSIFVPKQSLYIFYWGRIEYAVSFRKMHVYKNNHLQFAQHNRRSAKIFAKKVLSRLHVHTPVSSIDFNRLSYNLKRLYQYIDFEILEYCYTIVFAYTFRLCCCLGYNETQNRFLISFLVEIF